MTSPWCPTCGHAHTCHVCAPSRIASFIYCTCTLTSPGPHLPECPAALAERDGLDVLPPRLWREIVRPEWEKNHEGEWVQAGVSRHFVPVQKLPSCLVVILDTETTGLSGADRVCEIGLARVDLATGEILEEREQLINPGVPNKATRINGISDAELAHAPEFAAIWDQIRAWIGKLPVLAHNATFDRRMLAQSLPPGSNLPSPWHCTKAWAARVWPGESHSLQELATRHKLSRGTAHRALGDVRTTAALATRLYGIAGELPAPLAAESKPKKSGQREMFK